MAQYFTNFSNSTPGNAPTDWIESWDHAGLNWTYNASGYIEAAGGNSGSDSGFLIWQTLGSGGLKDNIADAEVLIKFQVLTERSSSTGVPHLGIVIRGNSAANASANGYYAYTKGADAATDELDIRGKSSGSLVFLNNNVAKTWNTGVDYWMRYQIIGSNHKLRLWEDGFAEPGTWDIEVTDSSVTAQANNSYVGIYWSWEASYRVYQVGVTDTPSTESAPDSPAGAVMAVTEGDDTANFDALVPFDATLAATEGDDAAAFDGLIPHTGGLAATEGDDTADFTGSVPEAEDTVFILETAIGEVVANTTEVVVIGEVSSGAVVTLLTDVITVSETTAGEIQPYAVDTITVSEIAAGALNNTQTSADTVTISEQVAVHIQGPVTDTLIVTETTLNALFSSDLDHIAVVETAAGSLTISQGYVDSIQISEYSTGLVSVPSVDTLIVAETTAGRISGFTVVDDTLVVSETTSAAATMFSAVSDSIVVTEAVAGALVTSTASADVVFIREGQGGDAQQILVINADTGAVSEYTFTQAIYGIGEFNGVFYLVTDSGLYALDNTDDAGSAITWEFRTGFTNLGDERLKSFEDVNALLRADEDVMAIVTHARNGLKKERHYKLTKLNRTAARDGVIPVGRGLSGTHWSFGMRGKNAAEIDEIRPNIVVDSRRR